MAIQTSSQGDRCTQFPYSRKTTDISATNVSPKVPVTKKYFSKCGMTSGALLALA